MGGGTWDVGGGFGTDIKHRDGLGRAKTRGARKANDARRNLMRKAGQKDFSPRHPEEQELRAKGERGRGKDFCGRDECGVVFSVEGEPCTMCVPAKVHKIGQWLCAGCHRPS